MTNARTPSTYRVIQLGAPREPNGHQANEAAADFDGLVTHHPRANRHARMQEGVVVNGEAGRTFAIVGGEIEEVDIGQAGRTRGLAPDQVLLKKDFILEDPEQPHMSVAARSVDVPSPVAGYVGRVNQHLGLVDIYDRLEGEVIARVRHMHPISVSEGQTVAYGETLGTQGRQQTGAIHVHMEVDTRYYQEYENYLGDLISGRLPVQAEHRENVQARPVVEDGTLRLGESGTRVLDLQRVMDIEGYRSQGGGALPQDGVYRASMQGAVLDFQRAHGIPQTGDIDIATSRFAPLMCDMHRHPSTQVFVDAMRSPAISLSLDLWRPVIPVIPVIPIIVRHCRRSWLPRSMDAGRVQGEPEPRTSTTWPTRCCPVMSDPSRSPVNASLRPCLPRTRCP